MTDPDPGKHTLSGLARRLGRLSAEKRRAALEISASLAGVSLRASREFVGAVPRAAKILSADDLKNWGEMGRRLAMGNAEAGAKFFAEGVEPLSSVPEPSRPLLFQICTRQLVLSSSIALESYHLIPQLVEVIDDEELTTSILGVAADVAGRSAKHSSDFLRHTPDVAKTLAGFGADKELVSVEVIELASAFAKRTGGMAAELWANLPDSLSPLTAQAAIRLAGTAVDLLQFGGSVTLHFISAGSEILQQSPTAFDTWREVVGLVAVRGNAVLIAFLRATPKFLRHMQILSFGGPTADSDRISAIRRVLQVTVKIAGSDAESALAAFRSSTAALRRVSLEQLETWVDAGIREFEEASPKARRSYFALETKHSNANLDKTRLGLHLESVQNVLRIYVEGLTGKTVEVAPLTAIPQESRIGDGKTIYLPSAIAEFDDEAVDFKLYKVLAAYAAGQIEFGTFEKDTTALKAAYDDLSLLYGATADELAAFSLDGYLIDLDREEDVPAASEPRPRMPAGSDHRAVLELFPEPRLARKIFGTMENARIDSRLRHSYRGLRADLDIMQRYLKDGRPFIFDIPAHQVPFELLFQITLCGGASVDSKQFYGQIVSEIEGIVEKYVSADSASVADALMAASRVYSLFQNIAPEFTQQQETEYQEDKSEHAYEDKNAGESVAEDKVTREEKPARDQDISDLFNAWNELNEDAEPDDLQGAEAWSHHEMPEQSLEPDETAFAYDEWDRELNDYRVGWSRVIEKKVKKGDRNFVELARSRYRGVISSIRHQFQLMKPENMTRVNREPDGEEFDLNALVDFVIDRRADGHQSEDIYTKRLRKRRDVAVSLLLDQSSSTARTITRNPLQPYTYPGRRIIEIEKEGLVLMSEALEAVGDVYSINGFTSEGRRNVKFYVVKDFDEKYSDEIEKRIGGITFQNNTRLGAAIRHAAAKLLRQESRTKLLIILTDGRPYDHDYGDARYAREDVREALIEAKTNGITPFCITIDRESESELKDLYGDVGYTIIDDVLSLPERMPNIYRRLTS
ncbi:MAG: VWA domain-containing protein [Acidobacteriota bacterium]